jgi:hypothetical protein
MRFGAYWPDDKSQEVVTIPAPKPAGWFRRLIRFISIALKGGN